MSRSYFLPRHPAAMPKAAALLLALLALALAAPRAQAGGGRRGGIAPPIQINSGSGNPAGSFVGDTLFNGGAIGATTSAIDTSEVTNPAPQAVYQTERAYNFSYNFTGLTPGTTYTVRLHFAEIAFQQVGKRQFNVFLNGTQVLNNFDIFGVTGAANKAVVQSYNVTADGTGNITATFSNGAADNALLNGIELLPGTTAALPAAPTGVTGTATASQVTLSWPAVPGAAGYIVQRSQTPGGPYVRINPAIVTGTTFTDTGASSQAVYYYVVRAVNTSGVGTPSGPPVATGVGAATLATGYQVNSGGGAVSPFVADTLYNGGNPGATASAINTSEAVNPAPQGVYQTYRYGATTYNFPAFTPGASYTVRLHFADPISTAAGQRQFNVFINGVQVLNNWDVFGVLGAANKAVVETYNVTADANGDISIVFGNGTAGSPLVSGIEVVPGTATALLTPPAKVTATAGSSQVSLTWTAVAGATGYIVQRSTSPSGPFARLNTAIVTGTTYTDTGANNQASYYYVVRAVNSAGIGNASGPPAGVVSGIPTGSNAYKVNSGGAAVSAFIPDQFFTGGTAGTTTNFIDVSEITQPAPQAVYQSQRYGATFSYTFPGLTPGASYDVRLHFVEDNIDNTVSRVGQRIFGVAINGMPVLNNFDILSVTGSLNKAITQSYNASPDANGNITIAFTNAASNSVISGIEILPQSAAPLAAAPTGIAAASLDSEVDLTWNAVPGAAGYIVQRSNSPSGPFARVNPSLTTLTSFSDFTVSNGQAYYYLVRSVNASGVGDASAPAVIAVPKSDAAPFAINLGGKTVGSFLEDAATGYYSGGGTYSNVQPYDTSEVVNPAPQGVYQSGRFSNFAYNFPTLIPGAAYTVRLHFADDNFTTYGQRQFNVFINNAQVLTNFDIIGVTGARYKAVIQSYNVNADAFGNISIYFGNGAADNSICSGIEVLAGSTTNLPAAPTNVAVAAGNNQVAVSWNAVSGATGYIVQRSTSPSGPFGRLNAAVLTGTTYTDSTAVNQTIYYYRVVAKNDSGYGLASSPALQAVPHTATAFYQVNSGGPAVTPFSADAYVVNGGTSSNTSSAVDISEVTNPAPQAVYQTERYGQFTYTFPGLTPGASYTVRLHFDEIDGRSQYSTAGYRRASFNINGTYVLNNFDIVGLTGAQFKAVVQSYTAKADLNGNIIVSSTYGSGAPDTTPVLEGIEVLPGAATPLLAPPTGLAGVAGDNKVTLTWNAVPGATGYIVQSSNAPNGNYTRLNTALVTGTTYTDTTALNQTSYYYVVRAVNASGVGDPNAVPVYIIPHSAAAFYQINGGGSAVSPFIADSYVTGGAGGAASPLPTIDTSEVANPAPQAVYQSWHYSQFTYSFPNLTPGTAYTVRLHFAELDARPEYAVAGRRHFSVGINGNYVLNNFDIVAVTGKNFKAVAQSYTTTADAGGNIVVAVPNGTIGPDTTSVLNGIEILPGTATPLPSAPSGLAAVPADGKVTLTWNAVAGATGYIVQRSTNPGDINNIGRLNAALLTGTTYTDTTPTNETQYYYTVIALNASGFGTPANFISATARALTAYQINSGGGAVAPFAADQYFTDTVTANPSTAITTTSAIDTSDVTNPAPQGVYQAARKGAFSYTFTALTKNAPYSVRLHFAEINSAFTGANQRQFNVLVNGVQVLTNFDITGITGKTLKAWTQSYNATADGSGKIVVTFAAGSYDNPLLSGIEVLTAPAAAIPDPPTSPQAASGSSQVVVTWSPVAGATGYIVQRGPSQNGPFLRVNAAIVTGTSFTDTSVVNGKTYFYVVRAVNTSGAGSASGPPVSSTPGFPTSVYALRVNINGGDAPPFVADNYLSFNQSGPFGSGSPVDVSEVVNPAPQAVYQSGRYSNFDYTIPTLTPGASYIVRMHFSDPNFNGQGYAPGRRQFNAYINGTQVFSNFDLFSVTGAVNKALVESFNATPDAGGNLVIGFRNGAADYAIANGIEVIAGSTVPLPPAVTGLTATAGSSQVALTWNAVPGATGYIVQRGTSPSGPFTRVNPALVTATTYTDTTAVNQSLYYYRIVAVNPSGVGLTTNAPVMSLPHSATALYQVNSGGGAVVPFSADSYVNGGATSLTLNTIDTSEVVNPAPVGVYQTQRYSQFYYTFPGLTPGGTYTVRLHFAELGKTAAGQRQFYLQINNQVIANYFDVFGLTGATNKALAQSYTTTADSTGTVLVYIYNQTDYSICNGIEILPGAATPLPNSPSNVTVAAGNNQVAVAWSAVSGATGYIVQRSTSPTGVYSRLNTTLITGTTYTDTTALNQTSYYYVVRAVNASGVGSPSANPTLVIPKGTAVAYQVNSAGGAVGTFIADQFVSGGATTGTNAAIDTSDVINPAPQAVYQTYRYSNFTYTFPNLTPGAAYAVRLHFTEIDASFTPGARQFQVTINGTTVLNNFDVLSMAGAINKAIVETFNATADASGNLTVSFNNQVNYSICNGIEILPGTVPGLLAAPASVTAAAGNGKVVLTWSAVSGATGYIVLRSTTPSGPFVRINPAVVTGTTYTDSTVQNGQTYYYLVQAVNGAGFGTAAATPTTAIPQNAATPFQVDAGSATPVGTFVADQYVSGGSAYGTGAVIDTSDVSSPAPQGVYQTLRQGGFTYTFPNLTPNTAYIVRLHLAEIYYGSPAQRLMSVAINGVTVLSGFDVFAIEGASNKALVQAYSATSDSSGNITIAFGNNALVNGIEILPGSIAAQPAAPTGVTTTPGDNQATIAWTAVSGATGYIVQRALVLNNGQLTPFVRVNPNLAGGTNYTDTGLAPYSTYNYRVFAVNAAGVGSPSANVPVTPTGLPFTLLVNPQYASNGTITTNNAVTVTRGGTTAVTITAQPQPGVTTNIPNILLSFIGQPPTVTAWFYPNVLSLLVPVTQPPLPNVAPNSDSSVLTFAADSTTTPGIYQVNVTATFGKYTQTTTVILTVK